jgi:hypothetical protein
MLGVESNSCGGKIGVKYAAVRAQGWVDLNDPSGVHHENFSPHRLCLVGGNAAGMCHDDHDILGMGSGTA